MLLLGWFGLFHAKICKKIVINKHHIFSMMSVSNFLVFVLHFSSNACAYHALDMMVALICGLLKDCSCKFPFQ